MSGEVKRFIRKTVLLLLPFLVFGSFVIAVDPFNYFGLSPVDDGIKKEISFKLNYAMWKMYEFDRNPAPNILLGDSRMMELHPEVIREASGNNYYNFAYGGGSLKEAIATYHFAASRTHLEHVVIGLDLNSYNGSDLKDRVSEVLGTFHNPFLYLTNNTVAIAAWKVFKSLATGKIERIGQPIGDRNAFWQRQLEITARVYFANYRDPQDYREQLQRIAEKCRRDGTRLTFIIFPSHKDLMEQIHKYNLEAQDEAMRRDLATLGVVYDFAWDNPLTRDRKNFKDPYHFTDDIAEDIIGVVWGGREGFVRIYGDTVPELQASVSRPGR